MADIAELVSSVDMYELAAKTNAKMDLTSEEKDLTSELDARFKEIAQTGHDADQEIAQFIRKTVNEEVYNTPDELLDELFDRGNIGEFDDYYAVKLPTKNTLVAHEAGRGGNVERSYIDVTTLTPTWKNFQIETDISFADVKKNGWKTVARITEYAQAALKNKMFATIFNALDGAITSGSANYITESTTAPTATSMDKLALYVMEQLEEGNGHIVALAKYVQGASKLTGFVSDEMKNEVHRTGRLGTYDGIPMTPISQYKKTGSGDLIVPDKRIFGIAGKIGNLDMKGELSVYQVEDPGKEVFHLYFKNFGFGYAFNSTTCEKVGKIVLA